MEEKLKRLCECVEDGKELSTKNLKNYGIYGRYITEFVRRGILERVNIGYYRLKDLSILEHNKKKFIPVETTKEIKTIFSLLQDNNIEKALNTLTNYLQKSNKIEYFYIIFYYIKISLITNDRTFKKALKALEKIMNGTYNVLDEFDSFVKGFFTAGQKGNIELAKIYYAMIKDSKPFTRAYEISAGLEDTLSYYENKKQNKKAEETTINKEIKFNYFGLTHIKEIFKMIDNNISINEIIECFNIASNKIPYLYLLIGEYFYSLKKYDIGDNYVQMVSLMDNKDKELYLKIQEVLINRKYYYKVNNQKEANVLNKVLARK